MLITWFYLITYLFSLGKSMQRYILLYYTANFYGLKIVNGCTIGRYLLLFV